MIQLDCSDWSNGLPYSNVDTRFDTEYNAQRPDGSPVVC